MKAKKVVKIIVIFYCAVFTFVGFQSFIDGKGAINAILGGIFAIIGCWLLYQLTRPLRTKKARGTKNKPRVTGRALELAVEAESASKIMLNTDSPSMYYDAAQRLEAVLEELDNKKRTRRTLGETICQAYKTIAGSFATGICLVLDRAFDKIKQEIIYGEKTQQEASIELELLEEEFDPLKVFFNPNIESYYIVHKKEIQQFISSPITLKNVDSMEGHEFEEFIGGLLTRLGYQKVEVTKGSGDQGVDVTAEKDNIKYAIQCKNYSSSLGNTPVQEVYAGKSFYGCHVGVVVTNNKFTSGAKELADKTGVLLWDRETLSNMIDKAYNLATI